MGGKSGFLKPPSQQGDGSYGDYRRANEIHVRPHPTGGLFAEHSGNIQAIRERVRRSRFAIEAQLAPFGYREAAGFTFAKIAKGDGCDRTGKLGF